MFKAIVSSLVIVCLASGAMGLTCYSGTVYDGSTPSATLTGCWSCTKTVQKYSGSSTATQTTYSGTACTGTGTLASALTNLAQTAVNTASAYTYSAVAYGFGSSCSANYYVYQTASLSSALNSALSSVNLNAVASCSGSSIVNVCSSNTDSGMAAQCTCCSDNCNASGLKCGATAAKVSLVTLLLVAIVGYFARQ